MTGQPAIASTKFTEKQLGLQGDDLWRFLYTEITTFEQISSYSAARSFRESRGYMVACSNELIQNRYVELFEDYVRQSRERLPF